MKRKFTLFLQLFLILIGAGSCDKDLSVNVAYPDELIVLDGWIENGKFAKVLLTRNSPYFSSIDSSSMMDLVLTRAKVTISNGEDSEILTLKKNTDYFPPFIYEGNIIKGDTGKIYTIHAEYGGKEVSAVTTIPPNVPLDTAYFLPVPDSDSLGSIYLEFNDPPDIKNYYRVLTKISGKDKRYYSSMIMCIDDVFFSGESFGFTLNKGPESVMSSYGNEYFVSGDTVDIKFCTIDKAHYEFWNSFQDETFNASNPFASSMSVIKSNIEGSGLGIWGGYGVSFYSLILK